MAANWGMFLCDCRQKIPLDLERLTLPVAPSVLSSATDPETDLHDFALRAHGEQLDRVLISCCAEPGLFDAALRSPDGPSPKLHFVNLKESCFSVHPDPAEAHAKATRLLRAAMETAEAEEAEAPDYSPLVVGGRILIAAEGAEGIQLADKLRDIAQPVFVVPPDSQLFDGVPPAQLNRGRLLEVKGHLGDFRVTIAGAPGIDSKEIKADQVVIISCDDAPAVKPRTGCQLLANPTERDLDFAAARVRELVGEFLKPLQVSYNTESCAGGTANQEACGICVTACPYDAIGRNPENHLRMLVDHMACEGCGACVSACPTSSLSFTDPPPRILYLRLAALLTPSRIQSNGERWVILFHCGEEGRRLLDEAGRRPLPYPANVLPIEVPCLRIVSEANMLAAFRHGAAGVGLLGCARCQHGERDLLYQKMDFCRLTLEAFELGPERLCLITAENGAEAEAIGSLTRFARTLDAAPVHWEGRRLRGWENREVIADAVKGFIEQTGREPGRRPLDGAQPFASAQVAAQGCTMCRACVNVCPTHAFKLDEQSQSLQFKEIACVACGLCEKACPENVITLRREISFARDSLDYQTVVQDSMVACAKCGKPYINRKALAAVEARVLSLESLLDTFSGNRRELLRMCPNCRAVVAMLEVDKGWKP